MATLEGRVPPVPREALHPTESRTDAQRSAATSSRCPKLTRGQKHPVARHSQPPSRPAPGTGRAGTEREQLSSRVQEACSPSPGARGHGNLLLLSGWPATGPK